MSSTEPHKYDSKSFREFLVNNGISTDSANSYASYLNGISDLLGKPIGELAADKDALNDELRQIHIYDRGKWTSALKWLFRFFHKNQEPHLKSCEDRQISDDQLSAIVKFDGECIKNLDAPIFRYMSVDRYYELIEDRYIALTHISHWEDPYEGFIYRGGIGTNNGQADDIYDLFKSVYGQSWTVEGQESDVLWRAMANGKRGDLVRIKTTVRKLAECLMQQTKSSAISCRGLMRIARIEYKDEAKFNDELNQDNLARLLNGDEERRLGFLFFKRKEFELEQEVRVAVLADEDCINRSECNRGDLLKFEVDPGKLIEEVLVDPCMGRREYEQLVCRTKFAVPELPLDKITPSKLFTWPVIR